MPPAAGEKEGSALGITCPPDRVPQTPAGGLRPPAPPADYSTRTKKKYLDSHKSILPVYRCLYRPQWVFLARVQSYQ